MDSHNSNHVGVKTMLDNSGDLSLYKEFDHKKHMVNTGNPNHT